MINIIDEMIRTVIEENSDQIKFQSYFPGLIHIDRITVT